MIPTQDFMIVDNIILTETHFVFKSFGSQSTSVNAAIYKTRQVTTTNKIIIYIILLESSDQHKDRQFF
jgi:hypothetical protein